MSETKNAFLRYQILDECFSNIHRKFFLEDLIKACNDKLSDYYGMPISVSRRTVQYDIDFMRGSGGNFAPIEAIKDGKKTYYRYSDSEYSFMKKDLHPKELSTLKDALVTMSRMKGIPGFDWVNAMQVKMEATLDIKFSPREIISFEGNDYLIGLEHLHPLYSHILEEQVIKIDYHPFTTVNSFNITFSPYYLKEYNKRWFVLGWNHEEDFLQTLALDRINKLESVKIEYKQTKIDFKKYFNEIIGVTNHSDKIISNVLIELSEDIVPYLETKPLHDEQWIEGNILKLNVKLNYELESMILSFGEKMKVLEPSELKETIQRRLSLMKKNY